MKRGRKPTHGLCGKIPEYFVWQTMRRRCSNKKHKDFKYYGSRGITVDPRWDSFKVFYDDMGPRLSAEYSIDRIDNDKGYSKENCRWSDSKTQQNNKRKGISPNNFPRKSKLGIRGVQMLPSGNYRARYKNINLGTFDTIEEASLVYNKNVVGDRPEAVIIFNDREKKWNK